MSLTLLSAGPADITNTGFAFGRTEATTTPVDASTLGPSVGFELHVVAAAPAYGELDVRIETAPASGGPWRLAGVLFHAPALLPGARYPASTVPASVLATLKIDTFVRVHWWRVGSSADATFSLTVAADDPNIQDWQGALAALDAALASTTRAVDKKLGAELRTALLAAGAFMDHELPRDVDYTAWRAAALEALGEVDALCAAADSGGATPLTDPTLPIATARATISARAEAASHLTSALAPLALRALNEAAPSTPDLEPSEARLIALIAEAGALVPLL